ncbi:MAG TPA: hypothetical protein VLS85_02585, partial [Hanamia sp.]|nr:hypothetical protein [Hanamia sp.]
ILKAGQVLGNLQDNSCLGMFANKTTADIGNMPVGDISACLNHVFDGMELSNKNEFQNQGNGTNFFGISLSTHTGKVQIYEGLPVMSPSESALKTAAWDYVFKHPEANTRDKQYSLYENYLNEHANNKGGASLPMVIHVLGEKNTGNPKSIDHIEVPMPSTEKPASTQLEEFGSSVQTILLKLKQYLMQSSTQKDIHVRVPTSVAAVRG